MGGGGRPEPELGGFLASILGTYRANCVLSARWAGGRAGDSKLVAGVRIVCGNRRVFEECKG